ncbi:MAG: hypothetical protein Kow0063_24160 [Anaerolineae bacterium]
MSFQDMLGRLLTGPSPADLLALQTRLLVAEADPGQVDAARRALEVCHEFYAYLTQLKARYGAREYSEVASLLDIGAVGAVALENLLEASEALLERLVLGGLSEILMVLASRQYVKAWGRETEPIHMQAVWFLRAELWRLSLDRRPDMQAEERTALIDGLLAPALAKDTAEEMRLMLLGRLFQVLLIIHLAQVRLD